MNLESRRSAVAPSGELDYIVDALSRNVKRSGSVILDPHPESDQHQNVATARGSPLARAYHV